MDRVDVGDEIGPLDDGGAAGNGTRHRLGSKMQLLMVLQFQVRPERLVATVAPVPLTLVRQDSMKSNDLCVRMDVDEMGVQCAGRRQNVNATSDGATQGSGPTVQEGMLLQLLGHPERLATTLALERLDHR